MTDHDSPLDDDLLSAVLDGEATPEERARVEASPEARQRLDQLRAAAEAVARPVDPLDAGVADALLARALAEAHAEQGAAPLDLSHARADRERRPTARAWWPRAGVAVGAAAAVVLLVVALAGLVRGGRTDTASDSGAGSGASATATDERAAADAELGAGGAAPTDTVAVDLGAVPDAATVLDRFATFRASVPAYAHQDAATAAGPAASPPEQSAESAAPGPSSCAVPPVPVLPGESWATVARADLPSGPVLVMADRSGGAAARVVVVDAASCAVLAEGTA